MFLESLLGRSSRTRSTISPTSAGTSSPEVNARRISYNFTQNQPPQKKSPQLPQPLAPIIF
ncbi:hypothetical protein C7B69_07335 [filamentous cyanobacterium Phorm 46]|nr:hypothetical protein C7B69_07335 [filamentous cyanobacterium Phorm 46]